MRDGAKPFAAPAQTANHFIKALALDKERNPPPATVFCSRELEKALAEFVQTEVTVGRGFPSDERIKSKARDVLGTQETAADDEVLLGRFREMMMARLELTQDGQVQFAAQQDQDQRQGQGQGQGQGQTQQQEEAFDMRMEDMFKPGELDDVLAGMDFDFTDLGGGGFDMSDIGIA